MRPSSLIRKGRLINLPSEGSHGRLIVEGLHSSSPKGAVALATGVEQPLTPQLDQGLLQFHRAWGLLCDVERFGVQLPGVEPGDGFAAGAAAGVAVELQRSSPCRSAI
jgi:hypothetical protein